MLSRHISERDSRRPNACVVGRLLQIGALVKVRCKVRCSNSKSLVFDGLLPFVLRSIPTNETLVTSSM